MPFRNVIASMHTLIKVACAAAFAWAVSGFAADVALPEKDHRADSIKTLKTLRTFPAIKTKAEWEQRAQAIREQALVSCGLWPMPEKTPLKAKIFDRVEREGYSVEKVYFQSYPGFYVGGNLYRPLGKGSGRFPAVLNPHGHWAKGRLEDSSDGSSAARCISFARQGMIAFAWDMVGYNDTQFARPAGEAGQDPHRHFANTPTHQLWGISQMGLQTWNAVRALDFILSLPDVDAKHVACTGESGGGTQTFMLGAIDDRLCAQAPIVMVSHSMQGGCTCENAPGLRVDYSNMEIAAQPAPRPQILVAATGDWTRATLEIEGPAMANIYKLFNAPDRLQYVRFDFNHNYNQTSREAVYGFFSKWLRDRSEQPKELAYTKEPDAALRVFPDGKLPDDAVTEEQLTEYLIKGATNEWWSFAPINPPLLERYRRQMLPAWKRTLQVEFIERGLMVQPGKITKALDYTSTKLVLGRTDRQDRIPVTLITPRRDTMRLMVVLAHPEGQRGFLDESGGPRGLARKLIERNLAVLLVDVFQNVPTTNSAPKRDYFGSGFFTTYNRTDVQERVQDLVTACAFAQTHGKGRRVALYGQGRAGLWTLLAAPASDAMAVDCSQFDSTNDQNFLAQDVFAPGLRKIGAFEGIAAINTTHPLLLHNTGDKFSTAFLRKVYKGMHVPDSFRQETAPLSDDDIADWFAKLQVR
jgi:dienelactone hydrolase